MKTIDCYVVENATIIKSFLQTCIFTCIYDNYQHGLPQGYLDNWVYYNVYTV